MSKKNKKAAPGQIAQNKKAGFNYILSEKTEAGLDLLGWEVKALRSGQVSLVDAYCIIKDNEIYLMGCTITPPKTAVSYVHCDPDRPRKLLLNRREIDKFKGLVERQGFSVLATSLYWKGAWAKTTIALGKGKQAHDKRQSEKDKEWDRSRARTLKENR